MSHEQSITYFEHYSRNLDLSKSGRRFIWPVYRKFFLPFLSADRSVRILDFGCGAGLLLEWLKSAGYTNAEGIDHDPGQVSFAESLDVKAHLVPDSTLWLRTAGKYRVIFMSDVLEHIARDEDVRLLGEMYTALEPGGVAIFKVPNANASFATRARYVDSTHRRVYTELSLYRDLQLAGFHQIQITSDDLWRPRNVRELIANPVRFLFRCFRRLEAIAEYGLSAWRMPLSQNLIAVCRRPAK